MTFPSSGAISLNDINTQLFLTSATTQNLNDIVVRSLASNASPGSEISIASLRGNSAAWFGVGGYITTGSNEPTDLVLPDTNDVLYTVGVHDITVPILRKFYKNGQLVYSNTYSTIDRVKACAKDAAGNLYVVGALASTADSFCLMKVAPDGTVTSLIYSTTYSWRDAYYLTLDSSGNVYVGLTKTLSTGGYVPCVMKFNSSLSLVYCRAADLSTTSPDNYGSGVAPIAIDSSGNVYIGYRYNNGGTVSGNYWGMQKLDTIGSILWATGYSGAPSGNTATTASAGYITKSVCVDTSGNSYLLAGYQTSDFDYTRIATVLKFNSSGVFQWNVGFSDSNTLHAGVRAYAMAIDSSNNLYVVGSEQTGQTYLFLSKISSSGVVQWKNRINFSGGTYAYTPSITVSGNILYITCGLLTGINAHSLQIALPTTGTKLGTYTAAGVTFTYGSSIISDNTYAAPPGSSSMAVTSFTPTFSSGSSSPSTFVESVSLANI